MDLCPIMSLLAVSPHALTASDIGSFLRVPEGPVCLALKLLEVSGRVTKEIRRGDEWWRIVPSVEASTEAISGVRRALIVKARHVQNGAGSSSEDFAASASR